MTEYLFPSMIYILIPLITLAIILLVKSGTFLIFIMEWLIGGFLSSERFIYIEAKAPDSDLDIVFAIFLIIHGVLLGIYYALIILGYYLSRKFMKWLFSG